MGESYPTIDVASIRHELPPSDRMAMSAEEWKQLRTNLRPVLPREPVMSPGSTLGPFSGTSRGKLKGFSWHEPWTLFAHSDTVEVLQAAGVRLPRTGPVNLRSGKDGSVISNWWEFEALPIIQLVTDGGSTCPGCGRFRGEVTMAVHEGTQMPLDVDLVRARNWLARYLVSERLADAIRSNAISGYVLTPLAVR